MIKRPHDYSLRAIRHLLKTAFDPTQLDSLCFDYYYHVFQEFSPQMQTDIKINILLGDCLKSVAGLDDLLKIIQDEEPNVFAQIEPDLKPPKKEVINTDEYRALAKTIELLDSLAEWKIVHENIQSILDKLGPVLRDLKQCRSEEIDLRLLYEASCAFQRDCATRLRIFHKYSFYYARTPVLNSLRKHFEVMNDMIRLMMGDISQNIFNQIDSWFINIEEILWSALTEADNQIKNLITRLGQTIEG